MRNVRARLADLGIALPPTATPLAAYVPAVRAGRFVHTSGQLPTKDGEPVLVGRLGAGIDVEQGAEAARICVLNALAAIATVADLDDVTRIVKVVGFVASDPSFTEQPAVVNGASRLLGEVFGSAGTHARSAVGVAVLPLGVPVEIEMVVEVR
ncbi:LysR family transcriptional regulator [Pseudonocardia sp. CNS-139]|nr:LysR family transcriptional regulator [Pseudonocardia sp. CNS-139]